MWLTTEADNLSSFHGAVMSTGGMSGHYKVKEHNK